MKAFLKYTFAVYLVFHTLVLPGLPQGNIDPGIKEAVVGLEELDLKTGDLLFFQNRVFEGVLVHLGTLSQITHVAMVVKDPKDGSLWLTHATDNTYNGSGVPVRNESKPRGGVIMTRLQSSFLSTSKEPFGFYKKIWVYQLNEDQVGRPSTERVTEFYEKNKHRSFETSVLRFFFSAYDMYIFGKDVIAYPENENRICSEYLHELLVEFQFPVEQNQQGNEYTPGDICYLITPLYHAPKLFTFRDGAYRITDK